MTTPEKSAKPSIPVVVDVSKTIRAVGTATQTALNKAAEVRQSLNAIAGLTAQFQKQWTEGSKNEGVTDDTRTSAQATLLVLQAKVHEVSTTVTEALVHVHNAEVGRRVVAETMKDARRIAKPPSA